MSVNRNIVFYNHRTQLGTIIWGLYNLDAPRAGRARSVNPASLARRRKQARGAKKKVLQDAIGSLRYRSANPPVLFTKCLGEEEVVSVVGGNLGEGLKEL